MSTGSVPGYRCRVSESLRLLLTRRWIGLSIFALLVVGGFGVMSHWQWDRAHRDEAADAAASDPAAVPIGQLLTGSVALDPTDYGRSVTVTGSYDPASQRLVPRGSTYFVIAALHPSSGGPAVPVVRGSAAHLPVSAPPTGEVTVTGRLQPYDGDPGVQPSDADLPAGQAARIAASALVPVMGADLAGGWVALSQQSPQTTTAQGPGAALPVITPAYSTVAGHGGLLWQNTTYAVQWVMFAGFVVFMWVRWFRDELVLADPENPGADPDADADPECDAEPAMQSEPGPESDTERNEVRSAT
jgi:cytochrome oxidase assembly protein ShyY1